MENVQYSVKKTISPQTQKPLYKSQLNLPQSNQQIQHSTLQQHPIQQKTNNPNTCHNTILKKEDQVEKIFKYTYWLIGVLIFSFVMHNLISGIFGIDEPVFLALTLISALALPILVIYDLTIMARKMKK